MPKSPPIHRPLAGLPGRKPTPRQDDHGARITRKVHESRRWREKVRPMQLRHFPLCCMCQAEGRITAALHVDHVQPIRDGGAPFDPANLRSLCASHHSTVTRTWMNQRKDEPPSAPAEPTYTIA
jgi:5-methylcytosine-specific restriction endonuclease McrA